MTFPFQQRRTSPSLQPSGIIENLLDHRPQVNRSDVSPACQRQIQVWETESQRGNTGRISKELVHMIDTANVLPARIEAVSPTIIVGEVFQDSDNWYDHAVPHVAGPYLIEAARQFGTAICHKYYDVPLDEDQFVLDHLEVGFHRFAEKDLPLFMIGEVVDTKQSRSGKLRQMRCVVTFVQQGQAIGCVDGSFRILDWKVYRRIRDRQRKQIQHDSWTGPTLPQAA